MEINKGNLKGHIADLIFIDGIRLSDLKRGLTNHQVLALTEYIEKLRKEANEYNKKVHP